MRPRCEFAASTATKGFCTTDCSAQPTRTQPIPRAIVRLRLFGIYNTAASDSIEVPPGNYLFGERKQPTRGTPHLAADYGPAWRAFYEANSVVQCGQRLAFIGMVIAQAGQSFSTGAAVGDGFFILFIAFTTRKMQNATIRKLMINVIKLP